MNPARLSSVADRAASPATAFQHCDDASTDAFLAGLPVTQGFRAMRRRYRRAFVERWPAIEDWFTAPFEERVGRLCGETQKRPGFPVSYRSRSHLYYLASIDRLRLDYHWLLAIGDLCVAPIADGLGLDLGIKKLAEQGVRHGYDRASIATSMTWVIPRITLHNGIWSVDDLRYSHIEALLDAIERFGDLHDVGKFRDSTTSDLRWYWRTNVRQLQLLLFHHGQISEYPALPSKRPPPSPSDRPNMQVAIDRWVAIRRLTLNTYTVDHQVVSLRHFYDFTSRPQPLR